MIKNFEETKRQLSELASVLNSFKSEAVQLRIIELVLAGGSLLSQISDADQPGDATPARVRAAASPRRRKKHGKPVVGDVESKAKNRRRGNAAGAVPTLELLIQEGFFKKRQTIGQIAEHCESSKARGFKPNEISGPLGRLVRSNKLKRQKNADGQYEYFV